MGWGSGVAMSCGVGHRRGLDPVLLWLWHRLVATAPIGSLAWEPPCAERVGLEMTKRQKKKKKKKNRTAKWWFRNLSKLFRQKMMLNWQYWLVRMGKKWMDSAVCWWECPGYLLVVRTWSSVVVGSSLYEFGVLVSSSACKWLRSPIPFWQQGGKKKKNWTNWKINSSS